MSSQLEDTLIYHITDVENLPGILAEGNLYSDAAMVSRAPLVIGHAHIKQRRLRELRVDCCGGRFVGEFVPFYFCPRSPMLYVINQGRTERPAGSQRTILHLVSRVRVGVGLKRTWAISDGNAGAFHSAFYKTLQGLNALDWAAIRAVDWSQKSHQKQAEFLVADFFPWTGFHAIGCHNTVVARQVQDLLSTHEHRPEVQLQPDWYYYP